MGARRSLVTPGSLLRYPGRHHPGMVGEIISEWVGEIKSEQWARSFRNGGRHRAESAVITVEVQKIESMKAQAVAFVQAELAPELLEIWQAVAAVDDCLTINDSAFGPPAFAPPQQSSKTARSSHGPCANRLSPRPRADEPARDSRQP